VCSITNVCYDANNAVLYPEMRKDMDVVFVAVLWQIKSLPEFFAEDLEFGSQIV
jgi:hypothetical protein